MCYIFLYNICSKTFSSLINITLDMGAEMRVDFHGKCPQFLHNLTKTVTRWQILVNSPKYQNHSPTPLPAKCLVRDELKAKDVIMFCLVGGWWIWGNGRLMNRRRKPKKLGEKLDQASFYPPRISHEVVRDWTGPLRWQATACLSYGMAFRDIKFQ